MNSDTNSSLMETHSQSPHHLKGGYPHALAEKPHLWLEEPLWGPPAVMPHHHEVHTSGGLTKKVEESHQAR